MIYGAINEKTHNMSKDLEMLFKSIGNKQKKYNWLITEWVSYPHSDEIAKFANAS